MASSSVCGPCSRLHKTSQPTKWCLDCEESLCGECGVTHTVIKALMSHHVIEVDVASSVSPDDLSCSKQCKVHSDFIIDYFCTFHDVVCCRSCIVTDHRTCESIMPLEVASKDVKISSGYKDTTEGINQICSVLQTIADDRNSNIQRVQEEGDTALLAMSSFKASVIQALDEKEKLLKAQLNDIRKSSVIKLESEKKEAEESVLLMKKYLQKMNFMENNGSCSQMFLLLQDVKTILYEEDIHLMDLTKRLESLRLVYSKEDKEGCVKGMGSVEAQSEACGIKYNPLKCAGAQEMSRGDKGMIKSFTSQKKIRYKMQSAEGPDWITGIIVTEDDNVIVSCPEVSSLQMYSSDGKYMRSYPVPYPPWDISYRSKRIVMTLQERASIQFINDFTVSPDELKVPGSCNGVALTKNNIFVGGIGELYILDLKGKLLRTVEIGKKKQLWYIHCDNNKVFITDFCNVYCMLKDGTHMFTFNSPDLKGADGIATDRNGYVYVVGRTSNNIHRLSSDGTASKILLNETNGIKSPIALCFNMDYSKMFVSNDSGKYILVFNCDY